MGLGRPPQNQRHQRCKVQRSINLGHSALKMVSGGPELSTIGFKGEGWIGENLLSEAKRRNLPPSLGVQSQSAPSNKEESPNPKHPMGATNHRQEDELKPKTIMLTLRSWTLGQLRPCLPSSTSDKSMPTDRTPKPTPNFRKNTQTRSPFRDRDSKCRNPTLG